jgi:hypothetical protein
MAILGGRVAYVLRRACRHAMAWKTLQFDPPRASPSMFESLQRVLRLATQCPAGPIGDDLRRAACELVEARSGAAQHAGRQRMLKAIAGVEWRRARGRSRQDDPSQATASQLAAALRTDSRLE